MKSFRLFLLASILLMGIVAIMPVAHAALSDGLVDYWDGDGTSCTTNEIAGSANLTANGGANCMTGKIGQGYNLSNSNTKYFSGTATNAPTGAAVGTMCIWYQPASVTSFHHTVNYGTDVAAHTRGWYSNSATPTFYGQGDDIAFTSSTLVISSWSFICTVVTSGTSVVNYFNGTNVNNGSPSTLNTGSTAIRFGTDAGVGSGNLGTGTVDEVGIWNRTLSAAEISSLWNSGAGCSYSGCINPPASIVASLNLSVNDSRTSLRVTSFNWAYTTTNASDSNTKTGYCSGTTCNVTNFTGTLNISFWNVSGGNYFNPANLTNYAFTADGTAFGQTFSNSINFTARNIVNNLIVQQYCVNVTNGSSSVFGCVNNTQDAIGGEAYPTTDQGVKLYGLIGDLTISYVSMFSMSPNTGGLRRYFNETKTAAAFNSSNFNISVNTSHSLINLTVYSLFLNTSIATFNGTNNLTSNTTSAGSFLLPGNLGIFNPVVVTVPGNYSLTINCTGGVTNTTDCYATGVYDSILRVNATNAITHVGINNFQLVVSNAVLGGTLYNQSTTVGQINLSLLQNYNYSLQFTTSDGASQYINVTLPVNSSEYNYTFLPNPTPSISITIRDIDTNALILENLTIQLIGNITSQTNYTTTGTFFSNSILNGTYTVKIGNGNYTETTYIVDINPGIVTTLNAFLSRSTSTVIMTFVDSISSSTTIANAHVSQLQVVNGTWQVVSSRITDITGRTIFSYSPNTEYQFNVTHPDYLNKTFDLDPILFSSYTIKLTRSTALNSSEDYQSVFVNYAPQLFYNSQQNQVNITFSGPLSTLLNYSYNMTYPGGSKSGRGNSSNGQTFTVDFNITGANIGDRVNISLSYQSMIGNQKNFNFSNLIIIGPGTNTFIANKDNTYGLGIIERAFVGVVILIVFVGLVTLAAGPLTGLGMALFLMGLFIKIGFWEWWLAGISFLVGFVIIATRST